MLRKTIILLLIFTVAACGPGKKKRTYSKTRTITVEGSTKDTIPLPKPKKEERKNDKAEAIISTAMTFSGTRYKYGGTTNKGMDCSGLVYVSLRENDIPFPRASHQMALEGQKIRVEDVQKGDLLYFQTSKTGKRINHVGLVVEVDGDDIQFIHATTSRGVLVSSLREGYWNHAFVKAMRIL
ncbi:NlpC/P60 family protein [Flagellimonas taeanensis]|jgi:cell wall-associated NlpC family hydrolase|uniref:Cell wall-associated hydrolase, NlpC family n=1 Tax=Flagellimonas taeanensis TaxID=1005926 RepID=A0A1M6P9X2_9FLAO|nr:MULTISPECIES: C40 family peptidase [Allomuricauda]MDC6385009.1 C40 family peptidase [Muricauda sp. SK9]MEE1961164.1 C40 family peptidase [Allomuricauda taeanensis]RIV49021.1 NlpC/P60 family protein [Allomuricauda taeanensis]SFB66466.1 Cell wall-associated hydrolase, NlpC family [Allomuricauda taeanensis]SHK04714.1 Cell wall-associated hydrolase, NlpC family [Allomuricauda taeanensis]